MRVHDVLLRGAGREAQDLQCAGLGHGGIRPRGPGFPVPLLLCPVLPAAETPFHVRVQKRRRLTVAEARAQRVQVVKVHVGQPAALMGPDEHLAVHFPGGMMQRHPEIARPHLGMLRRAGSACALRL